MADDETRESSSDEARENVNERAGTERDEAERDQTARDEDGAREETEAPLEGHETAPGREPATAAASEVDDPVVAAVLEAVEGVVHHESSGQTVLYARAEQWHDLARVLRDEQGFEVCVDVCGVDHLLNPRRPVPDGVTPERFEVVASFLSRSRNRRIRGICEVPGDDTAVPSLVDVYPGVDWGERETYDLFGIRFEGHPDLTRILLPEDWEGWPLRKDAATARIPVEFKGTKTTPDQQSLRRTER